MNPLTGAKGPLTLKAALDRLGLFIEEIDAAVYEGDTGNEEDAEPLCALADSRQRTLDRFLEGSEKEGTK